ncbi:hypothetical protein HN799_01395 [Candidatus Woesearchaeota archaeon]|jgi:hypothetical protein|nr:hypothetical protein [Candidatus Woesearchaeota archaeon]MBT7331907.1 hypothetical protein [Candidatus Woesearchaeota archaeon]
MHKKRCIRDRNSWESNKKGQLTIFIILGIVLIIAVALGLVLWKGTAVFKPSKIFLSEKGKVESQITSCISIIGQEALDIIGATGGYIEIPDEISKDGGSHLKLSPFILVPYWSVGQSKRIPSIDLVKERIDAYMESRLPSCIFAPSELFDEFDIVEKGPVESNVELVDGGIIFNVRYDLEVRNKDGSVVTELIDHLAESDIKLKNLHEMASAIMEAEFEELKLEDITMDLISLEHPKVPLIGFDMSCTKKKWKVNEVQSTLQDMLRVNVGELKVSGTNYVEFPEELPYYNTHYVWNVGLEDPEITVNLNYQDGFPFYFQVTPSQGNTMKSGVLGGQSLLSFLCLQSWKFTYDVSYPVMVELIDDTTGYLFNMAFTVHVVRNQANRNEATTTINPSLLIDIGGDNEVYCEDYAKKPLLVKTYELIQNEETGISDHKPLKDVEISYTCLKYTCEMGESDYNYAKYGDVAILDEMFPYCPGALLRGNKEGYKEAMVRVVTDKYKEVELNMIPIYLLDSEKIKVVKHGFKDPLTGIEDVAGADALEKGELASVKITNKKGGEVFHEATYIYRMEKGGFSLLDLNEEDSAKAESSLELLGGTDFSYELEIYVFDETDIKGGYQGIWDVDWDSLKSGGDVVFHVLAQDSWDSDVDMFDFVANLDVYSSYVTVPTIGSVGEE